MGPLSLERSTRFYRDDRELDCAGVVIGVRLWTGFATQAEAPAARFVGLLSSGFSRWDCGPLCSCISRERLSDAAQRLLMAAKELGKELCGELTTARMQVERVQPLHLLAAAQSEDVSATAEVLKRAGIVKETVIAAIKSGEYS